MNAAERRRRRLAEVALVGIAAVWGLTFVMVQDAIELLPTSAFLGYRFAVAALVVTLVFRRSLRGPVARGLAPRAPDGGLPHRGVHPPDARPGGDERLSALTLAGAALILGAIVAVEVVPRLRPPRPLPEG